VADEAVLGADEFEEFHTGFDAPLPASAPSPAAGVPQLRLLAGLARFGSDTSQ
jgi:hypothetical protein